MAMKTVDKSILNRMRGSGAGSVSSARQFLDLSNRSTGGGVASAGEGRDDSAHSTRAFRSTGSASDHRTDGAEHHGDHTGVAGRHVIREVLRASQGMSGRPQGCGMASTSKSPLHSVHENADVHVSVKTSAPTLASRTRASGALIPTLRRKWRSRCMEKSSAFHGPVRALRYGLHDGVTRVLSPGFAAAS